MSGKTILLVDDDSDVLDAIAERCRFVGWTVHTARNLFTATALVEKCVPDLVCVDVQMPTGNGLGFCEMLAGDPRTAHVPIVVLTGKRDPETVRRCRELGARYLPKGPDVWQELEPQFRKLIGAASPRPATPTTPIPRGQPQRGPATGPEEPLGGEGRHHVARSKTIVVADDDDDLLELLTARCSELGCAVIAANNAFDALQAIHRVRPHLVCLDVNMPTGNGLSVCEMMASDKRLAAIPVIILTGQSDATTIRRCHDMLAYYVEKNASVWNRVEPLLRELLELPAAADEPDRPSTAASPPPHTASKQEVVNETLVDAVFELLGGNPHLMEEDAEIECPAEIGPAEQEDRPWVLCIDDDADFSEAVQYRLEALGVAVVRAFNGRDGYRLAFTHPASAILLDYNMPNGQGDYILGRLKENPVTEDIPVIVITGNKDGALQRKMLALGAARFLTKPLNFDELTAELARHIDVPASPVACGSMS